MDDHKSMMHFEDVRKQAEALLKASQITYREAWNIFSAKVYGPPETYVRAERGRWPVEGLPPTQPVQKRAIDAELPEQKRPRVEPIGALQTKITLERFRDARKEDEERDNDGDLEKERISGKEDVGMDWEGSNSDVDYDVEMGSLEDGNMRVGEILNTEGSLEGGNGETTMTEDSSEEQLEIGQVEEDVNIWLRRMGYDIENEDEKFEFGSENDQGHCSTLLAL